MAPNHEKPDEPDRIVAFRPRAPRPPPAGSSGQPSPVEDLTKYARHAGDDREDDYRHRMLTNVAALVVCVLLVIAGIWIANVMADMRKNQDCVLSGRRACAPIEVPPRERW